MRGRTTLLKIYSIARFLVTTFLLGALAWFGFMTLEKLQTRYLDTLTPAEELIRTIKDGQISLEKYRQFGQIVQLEDVAKSIGLAENKLNIFSKSALSGTAKGKTPAKFASIDSLNKSIKSQKEIIDTLKEIHQEEDLSAISISGIGNLRIELEKAVNFAIALRKSSLAEIGVQSGKILQQLKLNLLLVIGLALILYVVELIWLFRALRVKKTISKVTEGENSQPPEPVAPVVQPVSNSEESRIDTIVSPEPDIDVSDGQNPESGEVEPKDVSQTEVPPEISNPPSSEPTGEVQPKPSVDIVLMQLNFRKIEETVDDINERISLMAFNALLEAARAGEAGKGFQIVGEELRRLADRSSKSASEVKKLFTEISNKLSNVNLT
jgi:hypothetical protein